MTAHETEGDAGDAEPSGVKGAVFGLVFVLLFGWIALIFKSENQPEETLIGLGSLAFYIGLVGAAMTAPIDWTTVTAPLANAAAAAAQYVSGIVTSIGGVFVVWVAVVFVAVVLVAFGMHAALEGEDDG